MTTYLARGTVEELAKKSEDIDKVVARFKS